MKLTNLVVNQTAQNIMQQFGADIEKAHQVGDEHPNGKWVWTKLPNGKYDWRAKKNVSGTQGVAGGQKGSDKDEPKGKQTRDERFSEDGIVGKDGGFNKQGKTYKRWADLREKVESGKATPEEKKEFAHLHNQYLNEKDRHAYEQSKQADPKAKEPKYKTVDERRAEYKGKKEEGKEKEKTVSPAAKKLMADKECNFAVFAANATTHSVLSCSTRLSHMLADGISKDSPLYKSTLVKLVMNSMGKNDLGIVSRAIDKYGADVVKEAMIAEKGNTVKESVGSDKTIPDTGMIPEVADAIILEAKRISDENKQQKEALTSKGSVDISKIWSSENRREIISYLSAYKSRDFNKERMANNKKNSKAYKQAEESYNYANAKIASIEEKIGDEIPNIEDAKMAETLYNVLRILDRHYEGDIQNFDPSKVTLENFASDNEIFGKPLRYMRFYYDGKPVGEVSDDLFNYDEQSIKKLGFNYKIS